MQSLNHHPSKFGGNTCNEVSSTSVSPSMPPFHVPRFGTTVPNRIFVGGISTEISESELHSLFSQFGNVKAVKIINDRAGVPKGYGFVTFETDEEAKRVLKDGDNILLKGRKLNVAIAVKKQPIGRIMDGSQYLGNGAVMIPSGAGSNHHIPLATIYLNESGAPPGTAAAAAAAAGYPFTTTPPDGLYSFNGTLNPGAAAAATNHPLPSTYQIVYQQPIYFAQSHSHAPTSYPTGPTGPGTGSGGGVTGSVGGHPSATCFPSTAHYHPTPPPGSQWTASGAPIGPTTPTASIGPGLRWFGPSGPHPVNDAYPLLNITTPIGLNK